MLIYNGICKVCYLDDIEYDVVFVNRINLIYFMFLDLNYLDDCWCVFDVKICDLIFKVI